MQKSIDERAIEAEIFNENGLLGMREQDGNILFPPIYKQIEKCRDFIWFLKSNGEYLKIEPGCFTSGIYRRGEKIPFIKNGKIGLKGRHGKILFQPIYDNLIEWDNADVIYTELDGEYHYYNHAGEEILTEVRPLQGISKEVVRQPYYIHEFQAPGQLVVREIIDEPDGNRSCFINDHWERLDRIELFEVRSIMQGGEFVTMPYTAFVELESSNTYLYSTYIAKAKGVNCVKKCFNQFEQMGCYRRSWDYITKAWVNPETTLPTSIHAEILVAMISHHLLHKPLNHYLYHNQLPYLYLLKKMALLHNE